MQIADRWFERTRISDDITHLTEPHVNPLLRCNIWHVRGRDADLLIDTGLGVAPVREALSDLIDKPLMAVATHVHYDHVGGLHEFETRIMHRLEAPLMSNYREFATLESRHLPADIIEAYGDADSEYLINALPHAHFSVSDYRVQGTTVTREVDEGDVLDLGDRHFEVLHLPGHSPGSMGLYEAGTGVFFSGDTVYDGPLLDELPESNIQDYVATMRRLRELPVSVVHAGHDPSFDRARLVTLVDAYLAERA